MITWGRVNLLFSAGSRPIKAADELSLDELLLANRLPPSLFQAYEVPGDGSLRPVPITTTLSAVPNEHKVILQCIRNTDVDSLRANTFETHERDPLPVAAMFDFQYGKADAANRVHLVDDHTLRQVVSAKVAAFLSQHDIAPPIVAGVSGGGDSNTLVQGIRQHLEPGSRHAEQVVCFTLVMDPIWPESAAERAGELCAEAGFQHRVMYAEDIAELLGMNGSPVELWHEFAAQHGPDTSHFFGTFLINLVGRRICDQINSQHLLLGYNREDVLAELLFCLINGRRPMAFPLRRMNAVNCVLPVWDVPKAILDACYPQYSESNYAERVDTTTAQRSSIYFIAHCVDALVPQLSISLMQGIARLMDDLDGWQTLFPIAGTPLLRTGQGEDLSEAEVLAMLRRFFPSWQLT
ncbi:hypothetical protein [Saccharopolyspora phatthalungensis]|uniref:tRNA(Ile)-lysidine synthase TilS/MesJ n=1 Tax=Saccharopolyspora phatthalungensis TaxID=664693 RepID=A0A840QAT8_9PSEU|nr:hypothetical protein [Saccharopolyspora phatthalungensis]MBB5159652.1 hypothetical protein [Saccharopolyspora phatthalungensis]